MKLKAAFHHHYYTMAPYLLKNLSPRTACWRIMTKSHVAYVMHDFELNQQVGAMRRVIRNCYETE